MTLVSRHKSPITQNILFLKPLTDTPLHTLTKKKKKKKKKSANNIKFCLIKHINERKSSMSGVLYFNVCTKFGLPVDLSCTCNETASRLHDALARAVCRESERSARLQMSLMGGYVLTFRGETFLGSCIYIFSRGLCSFPVPCARANRLCFVYVLLLCLLSCKVKVKTVENQFQFVRSGIYALLG